MRRSLELVEPVDVACCEGSVRLEPPDRLVLVGSATVTQIPGLELSPYVEVWLGDNWCCFGGLKSSYLAVVQCSDAAVSLVGPIPRLDLAGRYDPGGLEWIEYLELEGGDLLVVHEIGVVRISPEGSLIWQRSHDDLTARCLGVNGQVVWFEGDDGPFGYEIDVGVLRLPTSNLADDV